MNDEVSSPNSYVERIPATRSVPVLVLCDHAGNEVPPEFDGLGISLEMRARHIAWDIGAAHVARRLALLLGAAAILNRCSRLVIDPNRRPFTPTSIPTISDGCVVPGNENIAEAEVRRRVRHYFLPYHRAIAQAIGRFRRMRQVPVVIAVHSFTPRLNGEDRPWQVGVLWRNDRRISDPALEALRARPDLVVGNNQPYSGIEEFGFTVEFHAQRARLPHVMFELRQNEIDTTDKGDDWAELLAEILRQPLARPDLYRPWHGPLADRQPWRSPTGLVTLR